MFFFIIMLVGVYFYNQVTVLVLSFLFLTRDEENQNMTVIQRWRLGYTLLM